MPLTPKIVPSPVRNTNLVLTRREGEEIIVVCPDGTRITVRVSSIRGDRVRIATEAPTEYQIHRREVLEAIDEEGPRGKTQS